MTEEEIFQKLVAGEIKMYQIEEYIDRDKAIKIRRKYLEQLTHHSFQSNVDPNFDTEKVYHSNCENVIGQVAVPVGVAGPFKVQGEFVNGEYFVPIATTEGALVASINRGAKLLNSGIFTTTRYHGITRAPLFRTEGVNDSKKLSEFLNSKISKIKEIAESTSGHLKFLNFEIIKNGKSFWVRLHFDTNQAMGMNMATKATKAISDFIEENYPTKLISLSGNLCIDKKPATINAHLGRGREVEAEAVISKEVIEKGLKCSVDQIIEVNRRKIWEGSALAGSLGFNAHTANMIAGIFIATGQDPAHIVDASISYTTMEKDGENLYTHIRIPSLQIATIGGGTGLANQNEYLNLTLRNINSEESKYSDPSAAFSEIVAATVLAGELSLAGAFASGTFTKAHEDLGRSKRS